jgi:hypothetical protein
VAYITRSWTVAAAFALALALAFRALTTTTTTSPSKTPNAPTTSTSTAVSSRLETDTMTTTAAQVSRSVVKSILAIVRPSPLQHLAESRGSSTDLSVAPAQETPEGAGAMVRRSIGTSQLRNFTPFLMLDNVSLASDPRCRRRDAALEPSRSLGSCCLPSSSSRRALDSRTTRTA